MIVILSNTQEQNSLLDINESKRKDEKSTIARDCHTSKHINLDKFQIIVSYQCKEVDQLERLSYKRL